MQVPDHIVFFDGVCNLCNRFVDFLLRNDSHHRLKFSSLQGTTAKKLLKDFHFNEPEPGSVIFYSEGNIYSRSSAVLKMFSKMGFPFSLAGTFYLVPPFIRDFIYKIIATNRYKWFGKKNTCRIPEENEKTYFLP